MAVHPLAGEDAPVGQRGEREGQQYGGGLLDFVQLGLYLISGDGLGVCGRDQVCAWHRISAGDEGVQVSARVTSFPAPRRVQ